MTTVSNSKPVFRAGRLLALCACFGGSALAANGQAYTPPPPPLVPGPCVPTKQYPCDPPLQPKGPSTPTAADKFPFPGENPGTPPASAGQTPAPAGADKFPFPGEPQEKPAAPDAPNTTQPGKPATAFPFPGEPDAPATPSSSSSSSSSSSDGAGDAVADPNAPKLKDAGSSGSTRFQRRKMAVPEDADKRELDDLDVSHYYITTGNFIGAYMRAQDAVKLYPDDEQAHFALAVAADKMKKPDEAVAEYTKYLALAPDGEKSKQAKLALENLQAK